MTIEASSDILSQVDHNREKFNDFNTGKLKYLYASLDSAETRNLLDYIPFLLHVHLPEFPGYVDYREMPRGIHLYSPSDGTMRFVRSKHPSVSSVKPAASPFIQMFALMGSGGTIAFNKQSDFDFWVVADTKIVSSEAIRQFRTKCRIIEEYYAENYDIEVHFFLNDITNVKKNIFDDDEEAGLEGTSLGYLLKEEFFRSSIVMYGKIPFWWMVPEGATDEIYEQWLEKINTSPMKGLFVDLGNLYMISKDDFLIAALFQILKALGNPFKSIIKLGLLERYISDIDKNPYISNQIKKNVQQGKLGPEDIDAYIVMFNQVFQYYNDVIDDMTATNLIKTCFYLKINPMLSEEGVPGSGEESTNRYEIMRSLTRKWGWDSATIKRIDNFDNWEIDEANRLLNNMKKYLLKGYKRIISGINTQVAASRIHQETLKGISRKIFSHFSPEARKIDNSLSLKVFKPAKLLFIEFIKDHNGREYWILGKKNIDEKSSSRTIIYKAPGLLNIIAWASLHGLYKKDFTRLNLSAGYFSVDTAFLQDLLEELNTHFSIKKVSLSNANFMQDAFPVVAYVIINMFHKDVKKVDNIFFLYHNSWGETRFEEFHSITDLPHILTTLINSSLRTGQDFQRTMRIISAAPFNRSREYKRLLKTFQEIFEFFVNKEGYKKRRFITMLGNNYYVFTNRKDGGGAVVGYKACETELKLLYSIAYNRGLKSEIRVDDDVPELNHLRIIAENFSEDSVQIYYEARHKYMYYYISDERGSILFARKLVSQHDDYLARLYVFAENAINHVLEYNPATPLAEAEKSIHLYRIERDTQNTTSIEEINPELEKAVFATRQTIVPSRLSLHILDNGEVGYRFSLPDGGYSEIYQRRSVPALAKEIGVLMESVPGYTYFISDVYVEHAEIPLYQQYTSFAFSEKNRFELMVEMGLNR